MKLASTVSHKQRPAYYDEVLGDFYFTPPPAGATKVAAPPQVVAKPPLSHVQTVGTCGVWPQIATTATYAQVKAFLAECKTGIYSTLAKARLTELKGKEPTKLALLPPVIKSPDKKASGTAQEIFTRAWNIFNGKNGETKDQYKAVRLYRQGLVKLRA